MQAAGAQAAAADRRALLCSRWALKNLSMCPERSLRVSGCRAGRTL